jgi:hypothetical protein
MSRHIRAHLRHTGDSKLRFRIVRLTYNWGYNIEFGRHFLAIRDRNEDPSHYHPKRFFDLGFGRHMLKQRKLWSSITREEHLAYDYFRSEGSMQGIRLEVFLDLYRKNPDHYIIKENQNGST